MIFNLKTLRHFESQTPPKHSCIIHNCLHSSFDYTKQALLVRGGKVVDFEQGPHRLSLCKPRGLSENNQGVILKQLSMFLTGFILSLSVYALPQKVQLTGSFNSRNGFGTDVVIDLTLKKQSGTKAQYKGIITYVGQILGDRQAIEMTINSSSKPKTVGVANTYDGYFAFNTKTAYTLELNQQIQMAYSEYRRDDTPDFCNPIQDNFCRPGSRPPMMVDRGQINLTVVQVQ